MDRPEATTGVDGSNTGMVVRRLCHCGRHGSAVASNNEAMHGGQWSGERSGTSSVIHACCLALQAYYKLSQLLMDHHDLTVQRILTLEDIPEEFQASMKKLHTLRPTSALKEQLDSIVPGIEGPMERLQATYELMMGWAQSEQLEMPAAVRAMYS